MSEKRQQESHPRPPDSNNRMLYQRSYEARREQALGDYGGFCHTVGASGTTLYSYNEHLSRHGSSETQAEAR